MDPTTPPTTGTPVPPPTGQDPQNGGFNIPAVVLEKYSDLVELIKKTESMSNEEREYWFQILPIMTADQITRLKTILQEEATQLSKLDDQYQDELTKLNKKHLEEWNVFQKKQDRQALQAEEASNEAVETKAEEEILKKLDDPNSGAVPQAPQA
ncbi:MAG: hypothetical protein WC924_04060 [Candidatus Gracilibacteria bacterium]